MLGGTVTAAKVPAPPASSAKSLTVPMVLCSTPRIVSSWSALNLNSLRYPTNLLAVRQTLQVPPPVAGGKLPQKVQDIRLSQTLQENNVVMTLYNRDVKPFIYLLYMWTSALYSGYILYKLVLKARSLILRRNKLLKKRSKSKQNRKNARINVQSTKNAISISQI